MGAAASSLIGQVSPGGGRGLSARLRAVKMGRGYNKETERKEFFFF